MSPFANPFLLVATAGAVAIHAASLYWAPTQYVLRVAPVDAAAWGRMTLVASTVIVAVELHKLVGRRRASRTA
jgi:Ca2+-transporting ATPase